PSRDVRRLLLRQLEGARGRLARAVMESLVTKAQDFVAGWRFPTLLLSILATYAALTLAVLLVPPPPSLAQFADDFKVWCFGMDPASGRMERVYVFQAFAEPIGLG